jgi:pyruvate carboxylase
MARQLEKLGAHFLAIKDMAGLCKPYSAFQLVKALREEVGIPIHFHTHDTSGINAASILKASEAGVDGPMGRSLDEWANQPAQRR